MTFESNIKNIYGAKGKQWLGTLPRTVSEIAAQFGLSALTPVSNLSFNYVLSGFQETNPIILKLGLDTKALTSEAATLQAFRGFGAVHIIHHAKNMLILERVLPGTSLKTYVSTQENKKIQIVCNLCKRLHQAGIPQTHSFPHIRDWLKTLDENWELPLGYLEKARQLRQSLLQKKYKDVLLHGDLHPDNILKNGENWSIIDPKGVIGPPIFETCASIIHMEKDTEFTANFFNFPLQEVRECYFLYLILAICWNLEDNIDPTFFMSLADQAYCMI